MGMSTSYLSYQIVSVYNLRTRTYSAQNLSGPNRRQSFHWQRSKVFRMVKILLFCLFAYVYSQSTLSPEQQALLQSLQAVFNRVDTNGDGRIVLDEQLAYFDNLDLNKDGKLDYREFLASRVDSGPAPSQVILNATFTYYDTVAGKVPADGFLSRNDVRDLFQLLDLDGNGEASLVEFDTAFIKVGEAIAALINAKTTPRS
ncbi:calmodulin-like protein 1 [Pomacea canaliculata]|uniref:calmodulin-like protein 1 n=1 Tax=Pomacea canaliculata TaxID=400727 RepID=UPI000D72DAC5|nr:calmodulin-like protein 1 [Pomacea canaliculata]